MIDKLGMEGDEPSIGPATLSDKAEEKELEGSISSVNKHSITLQVLVLSFFRYSYKFITIFLQL